MIHRVEPRKKQFKRHLRRNQLVIGGVVVPIFPHYWGLIGGTDGFGGGQMSQATEPGGDAHQTGDAAAATDASGAGASGVTAGM